MYLSTFQLKQFKIMHPLELCKIQLQSNVDFSTAFVTKEALKSRPSACICIYSNDILH